MSLSTKTTPYICDLCQPSTQWATEDAFTTHGATHYTGPNPERDYLVRATRSSTNTQDYTEFLPAHALYHSRNLPVHMGIFEVPEAPRPELLRDAHGILIVGPPPKCKPRFDFPNIPPQLSSKTEPWRLAMMMQMSPGAKIFDLTDRMVEDVTENSISMKIQRYRQGVNVDGKKKNFMMKPIKERGGQTSAPKALALSLLSAAQRSLGTYWTLGPQHGQISMPRPTDLKDTEAWTPIVHTIPASWLSIQSTERTRQSVRDLPAIAQAAHVQGKSVGQDFKTNDVRKVLKGVSSGGPASTATANPTPAPHTQTQSSYGSAPFQQSLSTQSLNLFAPGQQRQYLTPHSSRGMQNAVSFPQNTNTTAPAAGTGLLSFGGQMQQQGYGLLPTPAAPAGPNSYAGSTRGVTMPPQLQPGPTQRGRSTGMMRDAGHTTYSTSSMHNQSSTFPQDEAPAPSMAESSKRRRLNRSSDTSIGTRHYHSEASHGHGYSQPLMNTQNLTNPLPYSQMSYGSGQYAQFSAQRPSSRGPQYLSHQQWAASSNTHASADNRHSPSEASNGSAFGQSMATLQHPGNFYNSSQSVSHGSQYYYPHNPAEGPSSRGPDFQNLQQSSALLRDVGLASSSGPGTSIMASIPNGGNGITQYREYTYSGTSVPDMGNGMSSLVNNIQGTRSTDFVPGGENISVGQEGTDNAEQYGHGMENVSFSITNSGQESSSAVAVPNDEIGVDQEQLSNFTAWDRT